MNWQNKVVLLTGASSGIGEGIAIALAKRGAILGLLARRENLLAELVQKCEAAGATARALPCDVTDAEAVQNAADKLRKEFGHIDILTANAGIGGNNKETRDLQPEAVKAVININLMGAVNSVHAVLPQMLERGSGHLVAVSSLAGFRGLPKSAAYSASKAGMTAFFESVRLDVQQKGIDVTIIQPGFIRTPLTEGRTNNMPFLMKLDDAIPHFLDAIERKKKFSAFPWQLATIVRAGRFMPSWLYDRIAGRARYRSWLVQLLGSRHQEAGIDPLAIDDIREIILYLKHQGIGIFITDHNVRETLGITDRAYIMAEGKILRSGQPAELVADNEVRRLYLGERFTL